MPNTAELATNIHKLSTVLSKVAETSLQECCGFGMSQFKILWMLNTNQDGVLQTTIASWLNQTEAAVSRQIGLMQQDGLIEKNVDPTNRRNHIISLTSEGKKLAINSMNVLAKEYRPYFSVLTANEQKQLLTMLDKIFYKVCKEN